MKNINLRSDSLRAAGVALLAVVTFLASGARADVDLAVLPAVVSVDQGEVFDVELTVTPAGSAFNGYDAFVTFDSTLLTFLEQPRAVQEGPLMTDACSNTFHSFSVLPGGETLSISHVLLCASTSVTGPGVVYRLRFQARDQNAVTTIGLTTGTDFYLAGIYVRPVFTQDAEVRIGPVSDVPGDPTAGSPNLSASPNPFNPATRISFEAAAPAHARVAVYSTRGNLVAELLDEQVGRGPHAVVWDGRDHLGQTVGSGVYMVRLELGGEPFMRRVTLVK
jgi:hypothetical protein